MTKSHESTMLDEVRQWRQKAYDADKGKPLPARTEQVEELARKLDLPLEQPHKTDANAGEGARLER